MSVAQRFLQKSPRGSLRSLQSIASASQNFMSVSQAFGKLENNSFLQCIRQAGSSSLLSDPKASSKILSQSSILIQDGHGFEELPILIRCATKDSFPFTSYSFAGSKVKDESEFDVSFRQALQGCDSVNYVFKLLEVPHNQIEGYSAAFALQRLHELKTLNTDWHQIHSFIRSAVMRELYDKVQADVKLLSSDTLLLLVECYLSTDGFSVSCLDAINEEIQARLADNAFTIPELLSLVKLLKESKSSLPQLRSPGTAGFSDFVSSLVSTHGCEGEGTVSKPQHFDRFSAKEDTEIVGEISYKCKELLKNVWIHLVSRYPEVDETTLSPMLQALSSDKRSVVPLLEKRATQVWEAMTPEAVQASLDSLCRLRVHNAGLMTRFGYWAYLNIHEMTPGLLLSFLHTFNKFAYLDNNLMKVMEKCLLLKGSQAETDVITMCVEYCLTCRYLSPLVLDAAASHLVQHGDSYHPLQLYGIVRAFGYLNYLPTKPAAFLQKAESCLWRHFDNMAERQILEVLGCLTFINVIPINFFKRVTSPYFFTKVGALSHPDKFVARTWLRLFKHAVAMHLSNDYSDNFQWVLELNNTRVVFPYHDNQAARNEVMRGALSEIVGSRYHHVLPFYGCCAVYVDKNKMPLRLHRDKHTGYKIQGDVHKKLVVMLWCADIHTVNTRQLLGPPAQRISNLAKMGFTIIKVQASPLFSLYGYNETKQTIEKLLSPHIDLTALAKARAESGDGLEWDWLSYSNRETPSRDDDDGDWYDWDD